MSRSVLDALLGRILDDGTELEFLGGLNFVGFTIVKDEANNRYNISSPIEALAASDLDDDSDLDAGTVADALDALNSAKADKLSPHNSVILSATLAAGGTANVLVWGSGGNNRLILATHSSGDMFLLPGTALNIQFSNPEWVFTNTSLDCKNHALSNVNTINGASVFAPTQASLTDANLTRNISDGAQLVLPASTLTTNRTLTLGTSGSPITGDTITVVRFDATANTYAIANGGGGGGTLFTFPASIKGVTAFRFDGTNWAWLESFTRIQ